MKILFIIYLILAIIDAILMLANEQKLYIKNIFQDIIILILIAINS